VKKELDLAMAERQNLADRQSEMERTQREILAAIESLESRLVTESLPTATSTAKTPPNGPDAKHDSEEDGAARQLRVQEVVATLTDQLAVEGVDDAWSADAMDQITWVTEQQGNEGSTLGYVDCRTTLCRAEIHHRDEGTMNDFTRSLPFALQWNSTLTMAVTDNADGTKTSTLFISRDGHDLDY